MIYSRDCKRISEVRECWRRGEGWAGEKKKKEEEEQATRIKWNLQVLKLLPALIKDDIEADKVKENMC